MGSQNLQLVVYLATVLAFSLSRQASISPIAVLVGTLLFVPRMNPSWPINGGVWITLLGADDACVFGRYIAEQRRVVHVLEQRIHKLEINKECNCVARGMHDILGHLLAATALRIELVAGFVDGTPDQAKTELTEVRFLTRSVLADVCVTVNNYRKLSLVDELT